jgi:hypothetical protein
LQITASGGSRSRSHVIAAPYWNAPGFGSGVSDHAR